MHNSLTLTAIARQLPFLPIRRVRLRRKWACECVADANGVLSGCMHRD